MSVKRSWLRLDEKGATFLKPVIVLVVVIYAVTAVWQYRMDRQDTFLLLQAQQ